MVSQHIARQCVVFLAAVATLLAGLTLAWGPDGGTHHPDDSTASTVLVPAASTVEPAMRIARAGWERPAPPWAFPFAPPDEPAEDGNQAAQGVERENIAAPEQVVMRQAKSEQPDQTTHL